LSLTTGLHIAQHVTFATKLHRKARQSAEKELGAGGAVRLNQFFEPEFAERIAQ
jgi:hypothetical protein